MAGLLFIVHLNVDHNKKRAVVILRRYVVVQFRPKVRVRKRKLRTGESTDKATAGREQEQRVDRMDPQTNKRGQTGRKQCYVGREIQLLISGLEL